MIVNNDPPTPKKKKKMKQISLRSASCRVSSSYSMIKSGVRSIFLDECDQLFIQKGAT